MQLLPPRERHLRMPRELAEEPGGAPLLHADTQEIHHRRRSLRIPLRAPAATPPPALSALRAGIRGARAARQARPRGGHLTEGAFPAGRSPAPAACPGRRARPR
ncbi:MAG: hypothetical protein ACK55I_16780, partial [bacterium]